MSWGWRVPFLLSVFVILAGYIVRRNVEETPVFAGQARARAAKPPLVEALRLCWPDMIRVTCMALANTIAVVATIFGAAYAVQPAYGIRFHADVYLWIPVLGNLLAVLIIPFVGDLSDRIGRRPLIIIAALGAGACSFLYLYAISIHSVPLAIASSLVMWGVVYQGYNAVFPSFYPELFPARMRVSAMAVSQNVGTMITALMPALFTTVAPPGSNVPLIVGSITGGVCLIVAGAAFSARETFRVRLEDLGDRGAEPIDPEEYRRMRARSLAEAR